MTRATLLRATLAAAAALVALSGCVATGPQPAESIPPALLASDLGILEASADTATDGLSVNVKATVLVERDEISADDLREILRIVVDNTHITNITAVGISARSDETEEVGGISVNVPVDLVPAAEQLGFDDPGSGRGAILVDRDDVLTMLKESE